MELALVAANIVLESQRDVFLSARQVKRRYSDITDMTLWRWVNDQEMGFPQPIYFGRFRFWKLEELLDWESRQPRRRGAA